MSFQDYEAFFEALESENLYSFLKLPVPEEEAIFHREPVSQKSNLPYPHDYYSLMKHDNPLF